MIIEINSLKDIPLDKTVIIQFYADWCEPCHKISVYYENYTKLPIFSSIIFMKNNIKNIDLAEYFKIDSLPTIIFIKNGEIYAKLEEFNPSLLSSYTVNLLSFSPIGKLPKIIP